MSKRDIENSQDVENVVRTFYERALRDKLLEPIFVVGLEMDLEEHIPIICRFWESVLLGANNYRRNPILKHIELSRKIALEPAHFDQWLQLWQECLEIEFDGPVAELALSRAKTMAQLMQFKIAASKKDGFIQ